LSCAPAPKLKLPSISVQCVVSFQLPDKGVIPHDVDGSGRVTVPPRTAAGSWLRSYVIVPPELTTEIDQEIECGEMNLSSQKVDQIKQHPVVDGPVTEPLML